MLCSQTSDHDPLLWSQTSDPDPFGLFGGAIKKTSRPESSWWRGLGSGNVAPENVQLVRSPSCAPAQSCQEKKCICGDATFDPYPKGGGPRTAPGCNYSNCCPGKDAPTYTKHFGSECVIGCGCPPSGNQLCNETNHVISFQQLVQVKSQYGGAPAPCGTLNKCPIPGTFLTMAPYGVHAKNQCVPCPSGTFSPGGPPCAPCPSGTYGHSPGSTCAPCPSGTYSHSPGSTCAPCPSGTYSHSPGSTCAPCPSGTYSHSPGSTCAPCPSGTYSHSPGSTCAPCPSGTYSHSPGSTCAPCPSGTYSHSPGSTCAPCPSGTYSHSPGSTCAPCPSGTYSHSPGSTCAPCPSGTYSWPPGSTCTPCPSGTYSQSPGSTCTPCPSGTYSWPPTSHSPGSACAPCTAGVAGKVARPCTPYWYLDCGPSSGVSFTCEYGNNKNWYDGKPKGTTCTIRDRGGCNQAPGICCGISRPGGKLPANDNNCEGFMSEKECQVYGDGAFFKDATTCKAARGMNGPSGWGWFHPSSPMCTPHTPQGAPRYKHPPGAPPCIVSGLVACGAP